VFANEGGFGVTGPHQSSGPADHVDPANSDGVRDDRTLKDKHPPVDPEFEPFLRSLTGRIPASITQDHLAHLRTIGLSSAPTDEELRRGGAIEIEERQIPGRAGGSKIGVLIGRPANLTAPAPGIVYFHGGGMIMGNNRTGIDGPFDLVAQLGVVVVSVEYGLAPEHPDPAPIEDCYAGLAWTALHGDELRIDADCLLVLGANAGGGLAAGATLLARDRDGPKVAGQVLMCPMLDDRNETPSSFELQGMGIWDRESNITGWTALLGDKRGGPDVSPYAAPARATDLSGLPATFIDVGSVDTLRDEVIDFAVRMWRAEGAAELHVWPGGFHGFYDIVPDASISRMAHSVRIAWIRRQLDRAGQH
jgi:acetyl esterase/lipase